MPLDEIEHGPLPTVLLDLFRVKYPHVPLSAWGDTKAEQFLNLVNNLLIPVRPHSIHPDVTDPISTEPFVEGERAFLLERGPVVDLYHQQILLDTFQLQENGKFTTSRERLGPNQRWFVNPISGEPVSRVFDGTTIRPVLIHLDPTQPAPAQGGRRRKTRRRRRKSYRKK